MRGAEKKFAEVCFSCVTINPVRASITAMRVNFSHAFSLFRARDARRKHGESTPIAAYRVSESVIVTCDTAEIELITVSRR